MSEYFACAISPSNRRHQQQMDALLEREGIMRDKNLSYSAGIFDDCGQMIATGSIFETRCAAWPFPAPIRAKA